MNPKCQTRPGFDTFSARSAHLTGLKMRRIARAVNELVGEQLDRVGHLDAERPGRLHVDHELEFGRLQDRQVRGLRALEDLTGVDADLPLTACVGGVRFDDFGRRKLVAPGSRYAPMPSVGRACR